MSMFKKKKKKGLPFTTVEKQTTTKSDLVTAPNIHTHISMGKNPSKLALVP